MIDDKCYLVDSDVFITAKNLYYAFDICPGFWKSVIHYHRAGRVFSIDRVRLELLKGRSDEDLVLWTRNEVPKGFFLPVDTDEVMQTYKEVMLWVQTHSQYFDAAKTKFATGADCWLAAYARVHGASVVTNEQKAPESKKEVKLPDVCEQFEVRHVNTFKMLRALNARFDCAGENPVLPS